MLKKKFFLILLNFSKFDKTSQQIDSQFDFIKQNNSFHNSPVWILFWFNSYLYFHFEIKIKHNFQKFIIFLFFYKKIK